MRRVLLSLALGASAVAWPVASGAQEWRFGLDAGRVRSTLDPVARQGVSLAAAAGYEAPSAALRLSVGVPTPSDSVFWGAVAGWKRVAATTRGITAGVDLTGNAFAFRMPGSEAPTGGLFPRPVPGAPTASSVTGRSIAAQALPVLTYDAGTFQLQARAGMSYHGMTSGGAKADRVARLGDLQLALRPAPTVALIPTVRYVAPRDEDAATLAGVTAVVAAAEGRLQLRGEIGRWVAGVAEDASSASPWSVGGELRVAERASVTAAVRRSGYDPLYLSPDQTSWSLGASLVFGRRGLPRAAPVVERDARGAAAIELPVSRSATAPRVAGDFNGWTPAPMERDGDRWRFTVRAAPGVYNYAFVAADGTWFVPEGTAGRKDDGMGGHVAVVVIR